MNKINLEKVTSGKTTKPNKNKDYKKPIKEIIAAIIMIEKIIN